jgi:hypothetical protein
MENPMKIGALYCVYIAHFRFADFAIAKRWLDGVELVISRRWKWGGAMPASSRNSVSKSTLSPPLFEYPGWKVHTDRAASRSSAARCR